MVATSMDACDNVSCSTSLHGILYKKQKRCKYQRLGMVATGMDVCDNVSCSKSLQSMLLQTTRIIAVDASVLGMDAI